MNEMLIAIFKMPLIGRAAIVMFVVWCIYALTARWLLKIVMLVPMLFNWLWYLIYKLINNLVHIFRRNFGKAFIKVDQTITDFFGGVYGFVDKAKTAIEDASKTEKPFLGTAFIILAALTVWIALPTWLHAERYANPSSAAYHKYVEVESMVLHHFLITAMPTASRVLVNGTETSFDVYTINGNSYFKLRDIAKTLSGTDRQFDVLWDDDKEVINLVSGKEYTVLGDELVGGDGSNKKAESNATKIYLDNKEIKFTAYTIGGSSYFKLRDLGQVFNFGIGWDAATSTIMVDTEKNYTAE